MSSLKTLLSQGASLLSGSQPPHLHLTPPRNRQNMVRALLLCAPLILVACGGSSDGGNSSPGDGNPGIGNPGTGIKGPVTLTWTPPSKRENGETLDITELGGYELRYRSDTDPDYIRVMIADPWKTDHYFDWLEGRYQFQIAAFDNTGLYSDFVELKQRD